MASIERSKKHVTSIGGARRPSDPSGEGAWLFDGENERPDVWTNGHDGEERLRWTKKQIRKSPPEQEEPDDRPASPFTLGDDLEDVDDPDPEVSVSPSNRQLPSDAVDLVREDPEVVEEARLKARRSGEPQTRAPVHVLHHDPDYIDGVEEMVEEIYDSAQTEDSVSENVSKVEAPCGDPVAQLERIEERVTAATPSVHDRKGLTSPFDEDNPWE